jgi:flagellar basal-body rod protein FlgC
MTKIGDGGEGAGAIALSALRAQQARMRIIAENIANSNSTASKPGGEPYRRQAPVFEVMKTEGGKGVRMSRAAPDKTPSRRSTSLVTLRPTRPDMSSCPTSTASSRRWI